MSINIGVGGKSDFKLDLVFMRDQIKTDIIVESYKGEVSTRAVRDSIMCKTYTSAYRMKK